MQESRSQLPSTDRMGMLIASVLLTFALTRFIQTPGLTLSVSLPGFYYAFPFTLSSFMTLFAAALTAAAARLGSGYLGKQANTHQHCPG